MGREAIVADWRADRDEPGFAGTAHYEPYAIEGDRAVAIGESRYTNAQMARCATLYYNLWTLRFDDEGQCTDYVEYFMQLPDRLGGAG